MKQITRRAGFRTSFNWMMASALLLSSTLPLVPAFAADDDKPVVTPLAEPGTVVEQEDGSKKKKKSKSASSSKSKKKNKEETVKETQEDLPKAAESDGKGETAKEETSKEDTAKEPAKTDEKAAEAAA